MFIISVYIIGFILFRGRRGMAKERLMPIFACEAANQGKLDNRRSSSVSSKLSASVAPELISPMRDVDREPV